MVLYTFIKYYLIKVLKMIILAYLFHFIPEDIKNHITNNIDKRIHNQ